MLSRSEAAADGGGWVKRDAGGSVRTFLIVALLACRVASAAEISPRAPCDSEPHPAYAPLGGKLAPGVWQSKSADVRILAPCADGLADGFRMIVTLSGSFSYNGDAAQLIERLGAVSRMRAIRYWSVTSKDWKDMLEESAALESEGSSRRRLDFTAAEMRSGKSLFFIQRDSHGVEGMYRMRIATPGRDQIIVQIENATPMRLLIFWTLRPGELQTVHFLKRRSADVWDYYLVTAAKTLPFMGDAQPSIINRAAAFYRYVAGQPTDKEPPLAP